MGTRGKRNLKLCTVLIFIFIVSAAFYFNWSKILNVFKGEESTAKKADTIYYTSVTEENLNIKSSLKKGISEIREILDEQDLNYYSNVINICEGWGKSGYTPSPCSLEELNKDYEIIKEKSSKGESLGEFEIGVSILNWFGGKSKEAVSILENLNNLSDDEIKAVRDINLASMYVSLSEYEKAEKMLEEGKYEIEFYNYYKDRIMMFVDFACGKLSDGKNLDKLQYKNFNSIEMKPYVEIVDGIDRCLSDIDHSNKSNTDESTHNKLSGTVLYNDIPLRGIIVYLKISDKRGFSTGPLIDEPLFTITDENGRYEIGNISEGKYEIGIRAFWNLIKGKQVKMPRESDFIFKENTEIHEDINIFDPIDIKEFKYIDDSRIKISWDNPVQGEFEYTVLLGEIQDMENGREYVQFSYINSLSTEDKELIIDIDEYKKNSIGSVFQWGNGPVEPYQIIEPMYHKGRYALRINSYSKDRSVYYAGGDNYGVYANIPYDSIEIDGEEWCKGDKLLLEKKYPEAIEWFENALEEGKHELHALKILSTLCSYGYIVSERNIDGKDIKKGIKYTEKLKGIIGENENIVMRFADLYYEDKNYEKAREYYLKLAEMSPEDSKYEYRTIGKTYLMQDKWNEALKYYTLYSQNYKWEDEYCEVLFINILMNNIDEIKKYSRLIKTDEYGVDYKEMFNEYINMERQKYNDFYTSINNSNTQKVAAFIENDSSDVGKFYSGLLILAKRSRNDDISEKEYYELYNEVQNKTIKQLMKHFGKGMIKSSFGDSDY